MNLKPSPADHLAQVAALIDQHRDRPAPLLPLLHAVQEALGHVPADAVPMIARALQLSRAEVHGVLSFYHHFRSQPPGRHVLQICRAEACQACGAEALLAEAEQLFGCRADSTRDDGALTLEPVYCLGLCATSPALQLDGRLHGRVTPERLRAVARDLALDGAEAGR